MKSHRGKQSRSWNSFFTSHGHAGFQPSPESSRVMVTWVEKHHHSKCPCFLLLSPALYPEHDTICYGIFPWSAGVSCPLCDLSQILVDPRL